MPSLVLFGTSALYCVAQPQTDNQAGKAIITLCTIHRSGHAADQLVTALKKLGIGPTMGGADGMTYLIHRDQQKAARKALDAIPQSWTWTNHLNWSPDTQMSIKLDGSPLEDRGGKLAGLTGSTAQVRFNPDYQVSITPGKDPRPAICLEPVVLPNFSTPSWDFSKNTNVAAKIKNTGAKPIHVALRVENTGSKAFNVEDATIAPGRTETITTIFGYSNGHNPAFHLNPAAVRNIALTVDKADSPQSFQIKSVRAGGTPEPEIFRNPKFTTNIRFGRAGKVYDQFRKTIQGTGILGSGGSSIGGEIFTVPVGQEAALKKVVSEVPRSWIWDIQTVEEQKKTHHKFMLSSNGISPQPGEKKQSWSDALVLELVTSKQSPLLEQYAGLTATSTEITFGHNYEVYIAKGKDSCPGVTIEPVYSPWNMSDFGHVSVKVRNLGPTPISLALRVNSADKGNTKSTTIPTSQTKTITTYFNNLDSTKIDNLFLFADKADHAQSFKIESVEVGGSPKEIPPTPKLEAAELVSKPVCNFNRATQIYQEVKAALKKAAIPFAIITGLGSTFYVQPSQFERAKQILSKLPDDPAWNRY